MIWLKRSVLRRWVVMVLLLGMAGMWGQFFTIVGHGHYHALLQYWSCSNTPRQTQKLQLVREQLLVLGKHDTTSYPAGWLQTLPVGRKISRRLCEDTRPTMIDFWHSPLTFVYGVRDEPMLIWYPGGRLRDTAASIVFGSYPGETSRGRIRAPRHSPR